MTLEWPSALKCQRYTVYTDTPRPKFQSVSLYDQPFSRYMFVKKTECTQWPQNDLNYVGVESTLYTLNTHPEAQISFRFALRPAVFRYKVVQKGNAPNDPRVTLTT